MSYRKLTAVVAVAAAALAVIGLAGCDTKVGAAAVVGGAHISDSDVSKYLTADAHPFSVQSSSGTPQTIVPRSYVLTALIRDTLFREALAKTSGGMPSANDIGTAEQQLTQGATDAQQAAQYTQYGFKASFAKLDLRNTALEAILAQRVGATSDAGPLLAAIDKLHLGVSVSGRYGTWDPSQLGLKSEPTDGVPSFIDLGSASYANQAAGLTGS